MSDDETATAVDEDAEATQDVVGETERQARIDEGDADPDAPTDDELTATPAEEPHEGLVEQPGGALAPAEGLPEEQQARDGTDAARDDDLR